MRRYETVFITNPDLTEEESAESVATYQQILTDGDAEVLKVDDWGRRRMAYEIKNFSKGIYTLYDYAVEDPACIKEMERRMRIDDSVIRFMTIQCEDVFDLEAYKVASAKKAAEAAKAAEARAAEAAEAAKEAEAAAAAKEAEAAEAANEAGTAGETKEAKEADQAPAEADDKATDGQADEEETKE